MSVGIDVEEIRFLRIVGKIGKYIQVLHGLCPIVVSPHLAVAQQHEQSVFASILEFHLGKQTVSRKGETLHLVGGGMITHQGIILGKQPEQPSPVGIGTAQLPVACCHLFGHRSLHTVVKAVGRSSIHLSPDHIHATHGMVETRRRIVFHLSVVEIDRIHPTPVGAHTGIFVACGSEAGGPLVFEPAVQHPARGVFLHHLQVQLSADPIHIFIVFSQHMMLQCPCCMVNVAP